MTPKKLGRYEVISELGKGAMGLVFLGRDPIIGRELALKTFRVGLSTRDAELEQFRARFLREAQSAGRLNHPNIVTIHDVVEDGDEFVIAMEFIKGQDLKQLMQRQTERLDVRFVIDVVAQIAEGLDYAHAKGVVHRDIKPANIIITRPEKDKYLAKITDFGIARVDASNLTVEGQLLGTPNYMAPEQIQGKEVDHRADLFSLGVMLYEMLTGKKPFAGENLTVVTHRIVYDAFTPPDQLVSGLPPKLAGILEKALQKDPNQRYSRGADFARDLRGLLAPENPARSEPTTASFLRDADGAPLPAAFPQGAYQTGAPGTQFGLPTPPGGQAAAFGGTLFNTPSAASATFAGGNATFAPSPGTGVYPPGSFPAGPPAAGANGRPAAAPGYGPRPPAAVAEPKKHTTWIVVGIAVALLLGSTLYYLFHQKPAPAVAPEATQQASRSEAEALTQEGKDALAKGDAAKAFELFERAIILDDGNQELRRLREQAHRMMWDQGAAKDEGQMRERLTRADSAIAARDYDLASTIVNQVLVLDPQNNRALRLKTEIEEARQRKIDEDRRVKDRVLLPTAGGQNVPPIAAPTPVVVEEAKLVINFRSEVPAGLINVYIGSKRIWEKNFEFDKGGVFRKAKGGSLREEMKVPAGSAKFHVLVSSQVSERPVTATREINATFAPDSAHVLAIVVDPAGALQVEID